MSDKTNTPEFQFDLPRKIPVIQECPKCLEKDKIIKDLERTVRAMTPKWSELGDIGCEREH